MLRKLDNIVVLCLATMFVLTIVMLVCRYIYDFEF